MGKLHSFRKYKKQIKYQYGFWWYKNWKWPGNFHPKQVRNMLKGKPFYIPNKCSTQIASIFDLTEAQFNTFAKPFVGKTYDKVIRKGGKLWTQEMLYGMHWI